MTSVGTLKVSHSPQRLWNLLHSSHVTEEHNLCVCPLGTNVTVSLCGLCEADSTGVNVVHVVDRASVRLLC